MSSNDVFETSIDWFAIDLKQFEQAYRAAKAAWDEAGRLETEVTACQTRNCQHGPFKKDGTPDKRRRVCEGYSEAFRKDEKARSIGYEWSRLWDFFDHIGLSMSEGGEAS